MSFKNGEGIGSNKVSSELRIYKLLGGGYNPPAASLFFANSLFLFSKRFLGLSISTND